MYLAVRVDCSRCIHPGYEVSVANVIAPAITDYGSHCRFIHATSPHFCRAKSKGGICLLYSKQIPPFHFERHICPLVTPPPLPLITFLCSAFHGTLSAVLNTSLRGPCHAMAGGPSPCHGPGSLAMPCPGVSTKTTHTRHNTQNNLSTFASTGQYQRTVKKWKIQSFD